MMKIRLWHYSGIYLIITGIIHMIFGILESSFESISVDTVEEELSFWFIIVGALIVLIGAMTQYMIRNKYELPKFLGWFLLAFSLLICIVMPLSGGWLLIPQALILIIKCGNKI